MVLRGNRNRERNFVTKYFKPDSVGGFESSLDAYARLKNAEIKHIPTTYRQVAPGEILMTSYNRDNHVAVSAVENDNEKEKGLQNINSIGNLSEILTSIHEDVQRASNAGITIYADCYLFIIPVSGGDAQIDFVIGDLDKVWQTKPEEGSDLYLRNMERVADALLAFISRYVVRNRQEEYKKQIQEWEASWRKENS